MYFANKHSAIPPVGSIMQYYGTSDPSGWIICDGLARTTTDDRYALLSIHLNTVNGVTTNTSNRVVPPNLKSRFLYGSSDGSVGLRGGSTTKTISTDNLPSHDHSITDQQHTHGIYDPGHKHGLTNPSHNHSASTPDHSHAVSDPQHTHNTKASDSGTSYGGLELNRDDTTAQASSGSIQGGYQTYPSPTGISLDTASTLITVGNTTPIVTMDNAHTNISLYSASTGVTSVNFTGNGSAFDIMPPYTTINHIMKY